MKKFYFAWIVSALTIPLFTFSAFATLEKQTQQFASPPQPLGVLPVQQTGFQAPPRPLGTALPFAPQGHAPAPQAWLPEQQPYYLSAGIPLVTYQQAQQGYQSVCTQDESIEGKMDRIFEIYGIDHFYKKLIWKLAEKQISIILDDSGSMNTTDIGATMSRWQEAVQSALQTIDIALILDKEMDVHFLNHNFVYDQNLRHQFGANYESMIDPNFPNMIKIRSADDFRRITSVVGPSGSTPLNSRIRDVMRLHGNEQTLILIITDGRPDSEGYRSGEDTFFDLIKNKQPNYAVSILACTNEKEALSYLDDMDRGIPQVDVVDDYKNELEQIRTIARSKGQNLQDLKYSGGTHTIRALLGTYIPELDYLDEPGKQQGTRRPSKDSSGGCCCSVM